MGKKRATYDDILALPEHVIGEIIDGELIVSPRPASPHALASSQLGILVGGPFSCPPGNGGVGGWHILDEPELHLGENVLVPDLSGWRRERMPRMPNTAFFELPSDWVCEIISPSSARKDRTRKMDIYAQAGITHSWLIDPLARTLEVYGLESGRWVRLVTFDGDVKVRAVPFDAVEIDLTRLWMEPEPTVQTG
jgi:Uma2 family endonuclease